MKQIIVLSGKGGIEEFSVMLIVFNFNKSLFLIVYHLVIVKN